MMKKLSFPFDTIFYVAGHQGMVGSAIVRQLQSAGYRNIITRSHAELDLADQQAVRDFLAHEKIDHVILAAAKVGGIHANNTYPAEFIYNNLMIEANVIHQAWQHGINHLLFLGSSCIYPKFAPQPMREEHLLTSPLEPTNEAYAIAKIAGIKLCESYNRQYGTNYRAVMPTNLYGPHDNYHLENSHVLPALIRKFHLAKLVIQQDLTTIQKDAATFGPIPDSLLAMLGLQRKNSALEFLANHPQPVVEIWGTGNARREFLHVDDMASACLYVMNLGQDVFGQFSTVAPQGPSFLNVGAGKDISIREIAQLVRDVVGFSGDFYFNSDKPDGTPRKLLDTSRLNELGWRPAFTLRQGLENAYNWYCNQLS
jgi:GDP-L-fucose synthase